MGATGSQPNQEKTGTDSNSLQKEASNKMIIEELGMGHRPVPIRMSTKLSKSICKITFINNENKIIYGTGFFMLYKNLNCLISVYHVINENLINKSIEIEIYNNNKKYNLELKSRFI